MAEKVIIIGGTAAGLSAASKAKRVDPSLEITVFERSGYISYGACGLPYFVGGIIDQPDDLVSLNVDQMLCGEKQPPETADSTTELYGKCGK